MSRIIMPRGIIKPPGLVLDLPMQGEQLGPDLFDPGAGGFEGARGVDGWTPTGTNTIEVSTDISHTGTKSAKITYGNDAGGAITYLADSSDLIADLVIGKKYRLNFWSAVNGGSSVGWYLQDPAIVIDTITSTTMVEVEQDFIATIVNPGLRNTGFGSGEIVYVDDLTIHERYTADVSGFGYHGTVNGPTVAQGLHGGCYSFITDDFITIDNESAFRFNSGTQDFTIMAWVKRGEIGVNHMIIDKRDANNDGWMLLILGTQNNVSFSLNTIDVLSANAALEDTDWHHIAGVARRAGNGQIYIDSIPNGNPVALGGEVMDTTVAPTFGKDAYGAGNFMNGRMCEGKIFNRALTEAQIQYEMYRSAPLKPVMTGGVLWP